MRLPLMLCVALTILTVARALVAEGRVGGWIAHHTSSDGLTVVSPRLTVRAPLRHSIDLHAAYDVDIISGASIDVITAASPRGYTEVRNGGSLGVAVRPAARTTVSARMVGSIEPDYLGRTAFVGVEREWLQRRLATALGLRASFDEVGRVGESRDRFRELATFAVDVSVAWVFSPRTVGHVAIEAQSAHGFMASPYRFVRVAWAGVDLSTGVPEITPDDRFRFAIGFGARHAVTRTWFVSTTARLYRDSWSVMSHTEELEVQRSLFADRLLLGVGARLYGQSSASFYRARYTASDDGLPRYRTADKMLAPMSTVLGSLRASLGLGSLGPCRDVRVTGKLELFEQRFYEFLPLSSRHATVLSLGLSTEL